MSNFGVEFDRDLVSVVEGNSTDPLFGGAIRGGTSLRVQADITTLGDVLDRALLKSKSTQYRKLWPDIDNLSPVTDPVRTGMLEQALDRDLAAGKGEKRVVLFTPLHRRGEPITAAAYVLGRMGKNPVQRPYLTFGAWDAYTKAMKASLSVATARATPVHILDESGDERGLSTIFDCIGYEASLSGKPFILSSGIWYEVVKAFLDRTNAAVQAIAAPKKKLIGWDGVEHEGPYNARCAKTDSSLLHFDAQPVMYGGQQSKFEFCDLMHLPSKRLYFVKVPSRSSGMSHLVEQTRRSVELFFAPDSAFRDKLRELIVKKKPSTDVSWTKTRPQPGDWALCLVSMGKDAIDLPFFARCSLANLCRDLERMGHRVEYQKV